jgi:hypothetical protein
MRLPRKPQQHVLTSFPYLPSGSLGEPVSLMRSNRIVHRYTGRPAADSAPVYEADGMEVSRVGKLGDVVLVQSGSRCFVHDAPNFGGKPFRLHDDAPHCHP